MISDIDLGRIAAYFDGEGCVMVVKHKSRGRIQHELRVQVSSSCIEICEYVKRTLGYGYITRTNSKRIQENNYKKCFYWMATCKQALKFLELVKDLLIEKMEQTRLAIEFQNHISNSRRAGVNGISKKEFELRESYRVLISQLKHGGLSEESDIEHSVNSVELQNGQYRAKPEKEGVETIDATSRSEDEIVRATQGCVEVDRNDLPHATA